MPDDRGAVITGPDLIGTHPDRSYIRLSDDTHPFNDEEALYAAVTTTPRSIAIPLTEDDFSTGSALSIRGRLPQFGTPIWGSERANSSTKRPRWLPEPRPAISVCSDHSSASTGPHAGSTRRSFFRAEIQLLR